MRLCKCANETVAPFLQHQSWQLAQAKRIQQHIQQSLSSSHDLEHLSTQNNTMPAWMHSSTEQFCICCTIFTGNLRYVRNQKSILHSGVTDTVALIAVGLTIDVGACAYATVQTNISLNRSSHHTRLYDFRKHFGPDVRSIAA